MGSEGKCMACSDFTNGIREVRFLVEVPLNKSECGSVGEDKVTSSQFRL